MDHPDHTAPTVPGALGAPSRATTPRAVPAPSPDDRAAPRSPVDPASMHRAEDDAAAVAKSRDFSDNAPRPESDG